MTESTEIIERNFLAYLLLNTDYYYSNYHELNPDLFADNINRFIFETYSEIIKTEKPNLYSISKITGDYEYLARLTTKLDYTIPFDKCLEELKSNYFNRKLLVLGQELSFGTVEEKMQAIQNTLNAFRNDKTEAINISDGIDSVLEKIRNTRDTSGLSGIGTGLYDYDVFTGGFQKSDLIILAGETSQGKTSLALTMIRGAASKYQGRIALFSYEMTDHQIISRLIAQQTGFNSKALMTSRVSDEDIIQIQQDVIGLKNTNIFIDPCKNTSIEYLSNSVRAYKMRYKIDIIIVDYLQLIKGEGKGQSREQEVGTNTRRLKNLAKELDITVICLSQLNREKGSPKPTLNRLRDSGQIEEAADQVIFVYRPEMYNIEFFDGTDISTLGVAHIFIAKGRNIGVCNFFLNFDKRTTNFTDYKTNGQQDSKNPF